MDTKTPNSNNQIVPEFESATQISREDQLEMRIFLVIEEEKRRALEERFRNLKDKDAGRDAKMLNAEADYVDRNLKLKQELELTYGDTGERYEERVRELKGQFRKSKTADDLRIEIAKDVETEWQSLTRDTDRTLANEKQRGVSREEFFKTHERIATPAFERAVRRER